MKLVHLAACSSKAKEGRRAFQSRASQELSLRMEIQSLFQVSVEIKALLSALGSAQERYWKQFLHQVTGLEIIS